MEVYKEDTTFRIRTPETIDPRRTNPNAPVVAAVSDTVGSSSPVVARVLLQGHDILETAIFNRKIDKPAVLLLLHACKESLVVCEKAAKHVASVVDKIVDEIRTDGIKSDSNGRALNPFPQVLGLDSDATTFLIHAKRAIHDICRMPSLFLPVPAKDNNFDELVKTLSKSVGPSSPITDFVRANTGSVRHLIELRNHQEHPGARCTVIDNFVVTPDGAISTPTWYVSGEKPQPIRDEMLVAVQFLIRMAEVMLIHLVMDAVNKQLPFIIEEIKDTQVNTRMPIKYRLSIDI